MNLDANDKINKLLKQYETFIDNNIPDVNVEIIETENRFAYFEFEELLDNKNLLYLNEVLFQYDDEFVKSIIFHELTHLYDFYSMRDSFDDVTLCRLMLTQSEYNASQIEILSQIYNSLTGIKQRVNKFKKIIYENELQNINECIIPPLASALSIIESDKSRYRTLSIQEFSKIYSNTERYMIYYFGKLDACNKYVQGGVVDLFKKEEPFYNELNQLHLILQNSSNIVDKAELILKYSKYFENAFYQKHGRL